MKIVLIILIIAAIIYISKKNKDNFFFTLVRDEEKSANDITGKWFLIDNDTQKKYTNCYMTINPDETISLSGIENENLQSIITLKGTYIAKKDNNQSIMQQRTKNPDDYEWYQIIVNVTEKSSNEAASKIAYGIGINKHNTKEMLLCSLNVEEVCNWNNIKL